MPSPTDNPADAHLREILGELEAENARLMEQVASYQKAAAQHRESEERLRTIVEHAPVVVFGTDGDGVFTLSEGRGLAGLGLQPGEVVGMSAFELYKDTPEIVDHLKACLNGAEVRSTIRLGDHVYEVLYTPVMNNGVVEGLSGVATDISERVDAEEAARALEVQLFQSQKMETIGTLAGGIAHDFNNILSPIIGYTDMAMDNLDDKDPVREDLAQVRKAAVRAKELVEQILVFSSHVEHETRPIQIHLIVREALKLVRSTLPATVEISQSVDTGSGPILANAGQIHQIVMNLCANAARAMQQAGGLLRIELKPITITESERAHDLAPGQYVRLTVRDTGEGMDEETARRIFEPFFTTKKPGEGTGLGLSVVHGIVKSHHGEIRVESAPGHGASFDIFLPRAESNVLAEDPPEEPAPSKGDEHVLVVDDEVEITRMLDRLLSGLGYHVITASDGVEAMEIFLRDPGHFDIIVTDQTMPRMTGIDLAKEVHAVRPDMPVILTTGFADSSEWTSVEDAAVIDLVHKPFVGKSLTHQIRRALDGEHNS